MNKRPYKNQPPTDQQATRHGGNKGVKSTLRMFMDGPRCLFRSRIEVKTAILMAMMCAPALIFCSILTLPGIIFRSPDQHAYYYFSQVINNDPIRWVVLGLSAICVIMSIAVPAMEAESEESTQP